VAGAARADWDWDHGVERERRRRRIAFVVLTGGAGNYVGDLGRYTAIGAFWGVTLGMQPLPYLGFEMGYMGSRNGLETLRYPALAETSFWRNGGTALVKFCLPYHAIRPFIGTGFGLSHVSVSGSSNGGLFMGDLMGEIPITLGVEVNSERFIAGFRFSYRLLLDEGFARVAPGTAEGGILEMQTMIGVRF
jgi:hypothetical protein